MAINCDKACFSSRLEAMKAVAGIQNEKSGKRSKRKPKRVYFCTACSAWHMTSARIKKNRRPPRYTKETHHSKELNKQSIVRSQTAVLRIKNYTNKKL